MSEDTAVAEAPQDAAEVRRVRARVEAAQIRLDVRGHGNTEITDLLNLTTNRDNAVVRLDLQMSQHSLFHRDGPRFFDRYSLRNDPSGHLLLGLAADLSRPVPPITRKTRLIGAAWAATILFVAVGGLGIIAWGLWAFARATTAVG